MCVRCVSPAEVGRACLEAAPPRLAAPFYNPGRETDTKPTHGTERETARQNRPAEHRKSHWCGTESPREAAGEQGRRARLTHSPAPAHALPPAVTHSCNKIYYNVVKSITKKRAPRGGCAPAGDRPPDRSHSFPGTARDPPSLDPAVGRQVVGRTVEVNVPMSRSAVRNEYHGSNKVITGRRSGGGVAVGLGLCARAARAAERTSRASSVGGRRPRAPSREALLLRTLRRPLREDASEPHDSNPDRAYTPC